HPSTAPKPHVTSSVPLPLDSSRRRHLRWSIPAEFGGRQQCLAHPRDPLGPLLDLLWPDSMGASSCDHAQNSPSTRVWATVSQIRRRSSTGRHVRDGCFLPYPDDGAARSGRVQRRPVIRDGLAYHPEAIARRAREE
uniref:Uncharacterized protein n=1 Tax=Triticum urartu TaxID=4572 RepID=A0A8R7UL60_TRIUA